MTDPTDRPDPSQQSTPTETQNVSKALSSRRYVNIAVAVIVVLAVAVIGRMLLIKPQAVTPPAAPQPPTNLHAFTGGKDIAVLWNGTQSPTSILQYNVYRDGKVVARVKPTNDSKYLTSYGTRYYDANVQIGKTYKYQISATNTSGSTSALTTAISVTQPTKSSAVPTIAVDSSAATDLADELAEGKKTLQTWYPKIANALAWPEYTPPTALTLKVDPSYTGVAATHTREALIVINPKYLRDNPKDMGMFVHEAAHVIQQYVNGYVPGFITEGIADWARDDNMFHDREPTTPKANALYTDGYSTGAYFLQWIRKTYNKPGFIRSLNIAAHKDGSYASVFTSVTGKSVGQLWTKMTGRMVSSLGPISGINSRCLDLLNFGTTNGNTIQLMDCRKNSAQDWIKVSEPSSTASGAFSLRVLKKCMDVKYSGKTAGTPVWIWDCNGGGAQQWIAQSNGTLKNVNSGLCLQSKGGAGTNGMALEIAACTGSAAQKWKLPPV